MNKNIKIIIGIIVVIGLVWLLFGTGGEAPAVDEAVVEETVEGEAIMEEGAEHEGDAAMEEDDAVVEEGDVAEEAPAE